jgi:hypothetical protein
MSALLRRVVDRFRGRRAPRPFEPETETCAPTRTTAREL